VDVSPINKKGQTLLHLAVLSRSTETVAVLLDKGAVVSAGLGRKYGIACGRLIKAIER
jgi:ankyrin repeat protein